MELKTPNGKIIKVDWEPCAEGCHGWLHFNDPYEIEACDECGRFKGDDCISRDDLAIKAHKEECGCQWPDIDLQSAAMAWVTDLQSFAGSKAHPNPTEPEVMALAVLLDEREVPFMDNLPLAMKLCETLIRTTAEGPQLNRLTHLMSVLKKTSEGIHNEELKIKDFGFPPMEDKDGEEQEATERLH